jgi:uncharacterized protein YndB with AHSA1/START domain
VPTTRRSRTIEAPVEELWRVIRDPHHLPRWWPRVNRVEDVYEGAFTEVMTTAKGKVVRADFHIVEVRESMHSLSWEQSVQGTPFERVLKAARTEVSLTALGAGAAPVPAAGAGGSAETTGKRAATYVTIELRQTLHGFFTRFGGYMVRRATASTIEGALDGLERISG